MSITRKLLLLVATLWLAAVAYVASSTWPHLPLDLPAHDPAVRGALARAVRTHLLWHALVGLGPIALTGLVMLVLRWRRQPRRSGDARH